MVAIPERVYAQVSPLSNGMSLFDQRVFTGERQITADNVSLVLSEADVIVAAASRLQQAGFTIDFMSPATISISAPHDTYESAFNCRLYAEERPVLKAQGRADQATFVDCRDTAESGLIRTGDTGFADVIEGVAIEEPRYLMADAMPPRRSYWHLNVPGDVALGCNAERAHLGGTVGTGVRVVMVDSGHYAHPYFAAHRYQINPVVLGPGSARAHDDENGHGTAESANLLAIAPGVDFTMVKMSFVNTVGAFNAAVGLNPHIISCSWGVSVQNGPLSAADNALAAAIALAVARGIIVVFSAGNGHYGFPGQHPDVISAGGVYMDESGALRASDYASGFQSAVYPGRVVPDLAGLVGQRPRAAYIMLPVQPSSRIDDDLSRGGAHPGSDETAADDGWAAISGTSAAAPQIAGACALIKQVYPQATPAEVKELLRATARDVTEGMCHAGTGGHKAAAGADLATGSGLVDVEKAVLKAKLASTQASSAPNNSRMGIRSGMGIRGAELAEALAPVDGVSGAQPPVLSAAEAKYLEGLL